MSGGDRKFGRHRDRSPAMARYRGTHRSEINKKRKIERHRKMTAKKSDKLARREAKLEQERDTIHGPYQTAGTNGQPIDC